MSKSKLNKFSLQNTGKFVWVFLVSTCVRNVSDVKVEMTTDITDLYEDADRKTVSTRAVALDSQNKERPL
ncbi:MAG: hypothetical protein HON27_16260 [Candidatus Marinimicrobia bacterium]|jgi:hypothetical protein|nr:hypothetical protein [Candidatus Neomarinimicrobiota bacterium]MBT4947700.1 hypothetical protein [Candidatus Neomarinimicrobiota bacterium]MBT5270634.1 hypothetical protein [Candidatus Neomarinimicrobiota bacterium]